MSQEGKVAFITGGLGGIGFSFGENLLQHGAKVALIDIRNGGEDLKKKHGEDKVMSLKCDVTDTQQLRDAYQKTVDTFGGIDLVINCVGVVDEINYERTIQINLTSVITSSYMAVERMRKDRGGRGGTLINIASVAAAGGMKYVLVYSSTKAAIVAFDKCLVANLGDNEDIQVKIGTISPHTVDTGIIAQLKNSSLRENDVTQPKVHENLDVILRDLNPETYMSPQRMSDVLLKYLEEPELHGSVITVTNNEVQYDYPDNLKGKKIDMEQK